MRINHNISAVITNNQLLGNEDILAKSMERLSSGLSINHASDDPSGMAISSKMKAQIEGLGQASDNSSDGISVIQTADGALNEVTDMLQRIRELSVQAANGTNAISDRESIQAEIDQLKEEIDRISECTEFNTKNLLDGSLNARVYADHCTRVESNANVSKGYYKLTVDKAAERAKTGITDPTGVTLPNDADGNPLEGSISINGHAVELVSGLTGADLYLTLRDAAKYGDAELTKDDKTGDYEIVSTEIGRKAELDIQVEPKEFAAALGITNSDPNNPTVGKDAQITLARYEKGVEDSLFGTHATATSDGRKTTVTDVNGFELSFMLEEEYTGDIEFNVTDVGIMQLQIGANEGQTMDVRIPATDTEHLYIDTLDVSTENGPEKAITQIDGALSSLLKVRSTLGAYENRLEHTVKSVDGTEENMTSAISRLADVDMAEEMVTYTSYNVLVQAATSALSQANELPDLALQLLK